MKNTYRGLMAEIARLQAKADQLRKAELKGVIAQIQKAVEQYGLTAEDLGLGAGDGTPAAGKKAAAKKSPGRPRRAKAAGAAKGSKGAPKYRDPKTGKTWTGRGKPPLWIAGVTDRSPFLIGAAPAAEAPAEPVAKKAKAGRPVASAKRAKPARAAKKATPAKAAKPAKAPAKKAPAGKKAAAKPAPKKARKAGSEPAPAPAEAPTPTSAG